MSTVDAVDSDRPISPNIFAAVWLVDRLCEETLSFLSVADLVWSGCYSAIERRRKNRNEFDYGGNVDAESIMAVRRG
jgi:hypothetical protein